MKRIAIFASGSGTNMRNIASYFEAYADIELSLVVCNKTGAGVIDHAKQFNIPVLMVNKQMLYETNELTEILKKLKVDLIVLAGFLWLIPKNLINSFPNKIINIHPALLPEFGGRGMYGEKVHKAVIASGKPYSGITIHFVNENYDEGAILFQEKIKIGENESAESLAEKIHQLEYLHYPVVIAQLLKKID